MIIDSHCHLHDREFYTKDEAEECLVRAREAEVEKIVCIGTSHEDSLAAREFAAGRKGVYWTYGIHPEHAGMAGGSELWGDLANLAETVASCFDESLVAIGEVGLDYHYEGYERASQIRLFEEMLQLATGNDLPVSFHI